MSSLATATIWKRRIEEGAQQFSKVPSWVTPELVRSLLYSDVALGVITVEQYKEFTGEV